MNEYKTVRYHFGNTRTDDALAAMEADGWQVQDSGIIQEEGRTYYAVVWRREEKFVDRAGGMPHERFEDAVEPTDDPQIILVEGMELELADGEQVTVSGITMKNGEVHRVKVTKPNPDNDTNITTTMKLETLIGKLPEDHPWHNSPPHVQA